MRFYQHVYGRVMKGYTGASPGYQLAALSDELADKPEMIEKLNRFSFFNMRGGQGDEARFSFYRPAKGFLAFGCSRLARDRTGAIGSFAHHFVCEESEFLRASFSPSSLIRRLASADVEIKFFESESHLPANRSLDAREFQPESAEPQGGRFHALALEIGNIFLNKTEQAIPLVVASDEDAWAILDELFSLLPRLEASRLSFSTLFVDASEFTWSFKLIFVPDRKFIPVESYNYAIFETGEAISRPSRPVPLISLWMDRAGEAPRFLEFANTLRHAPARRQEAETLLDSLLPLGAIFRDSIESLQIPNVFNLILKNADWIVAYRRAGKPLVYEDMIETIWENTLGPEAYFVPLLKAAPQLDQPGFADSLLIDLARRAASDQAEVSLICSLPSPDMLNRFYMLAADRLKLSDQQKLARRLRGQPFYHNQLHDSIARHVVGLIRSDQREWIEPARWLQSEQDALGAHTFARAALDLANWVYSKGRQSLRLSGYQIDRRQYSDLLEAAWRGGADFIKVDWVDDCFYHQNHYEYYFAFLVARLRASGLSTQKGILRIIAARFRSQAARNRDLVEAIKRDDDASSLAKYLREQLRDNNALDDRASDILKSIERESKWKLF
ncbi:MAG: hypothetical protein AB1631_12785 [Acidobacteriota bacterium]